MTPIAGPLNCDFQKAIAFLDQLDSPREEWQLFFHRKNLSHDSWHRRFQKWLIHFALYKKIKNNVPGCDIDSMFQHLTILDTKFSLALNLNSLMLAAIALILTRLSDMTMTITNTGIRRDMFVVFISICGIVGALCLTNMWICLQGVRRVVWGDLGLWVKEIPDHHAGHKIMVEGDIDRAESDHVSFLILSIVRRTNRYRIATYLMKTALVFLFVLFLCTFLLLLLEQTINLRFP